MRHYLFAIAIIFPLNFACTSNSKSGGTRTPASHDPNEDREFDTVPVGINTGTDTDLEDLTPNCDPDKDFHKLEYPQPIKDCLLQKKIYNHDSEQCTPMNKAYFTCDYATLSAEIKDLGLSTAALDKQISAGGKLIGCGVSNNGTIIVAQFFYKASQQAASSCEFTKAGKVVSTCFRGFMGGQPVVQPTDEAGAREYMKQCMIE